MVKARLVCAAVVLGIAGFASASALVAVARAQDPVPEPTTTVAPPPEPAPDPAPPVAPAAPKPKPAAPAPRPRPRVITPAPTPASQQPTAPTPPVVQSESTTRRVTPARRKAKPKKAVRPKVPTERKASVAGAEIAKTLKPAAVLPAPTVAGRENSSDLAAALIIATLALAIACFGITSIPRTLLPRRTAYFVIEHQMELVFVGAGLFALTLFTYFWSGGP